MQKTINFSNHSWSCWWFLANTEAWNALPRDIQDVVSRNVVKYGALQRRDSQQLTASLADKLHNARATLEDYRGLDEAPWTRFTAGREGMLWYYRVFCDAFLAHGSTPRTRESECTV